MLHVDGPLLDVNEQYVSINDEKHKVGEKI
jgi:hypothetical protein